MGWVSCWVLLSDEVELTQFVCMYVCLHTHVCLCCVTLSFHSNRHLWATLPGNQPSIGSVFSIGLFLFLPQPEHGTHWRTQLADAPTKYWQTSGHTTGGTWESWWQPTRALICNWCDCHCLGGEGLVAFFKRKRAHKVRDDTTSFLVSPTLSYWEWW